MFLTPLILEADPQPEIWIVMAPLVWQGEFGPITVPVGFRTDLASIPVSFRKLQQFDANGISRRPAVLHDWGYAWRGIGKDNADELLRLSLLAEGATEFVAQTFYLGVHVFGQAAWDDAAEALEARDFDTNEHYQNWVHAR
jgi:Protein of unknown function (DUF1353)